MNNTKNNVITSKFYALFISVLLGIALIGCASTHHKDPLQSVNRNIDKFNNAADNYVFKPVASTYKTVVPSPARKGINNYFNNLGTLTTVLNDLLQLKFEYAFVDASRFVINSTFGIAGLIDIASMDNIPQRKEDFGQTLGYWGVGSGPYLIFPFAGPSTVRDAIGFSIDTATSDVLSYVHNIGEIRTHNQLRITRAINQRAQLLNTKEIMDGASLDAYAFMREAYLQRRAGLIKDGLVEPEDLEWFEPADEDLELMEEESIQK